MSAGAGPRSLAGGIFALAVALLAGCVHSGAGAAADEIRAHIREIRGAILAKDAVGIVRFGTAGWRFTGPEGTTYDRAAYLARTTALFARIEAIESLDTHIDRIDVSGDRADVELTQTMIRRERGEAGGAGETGGAVTRVWLRYREHHVWRRLPEGWRVASVAFLGAPERKILP